MADRILDDFPGGGPRRRRPRIAVRGWVGFAEAASLEWLEHRELTRDELRDLLIQALTGAVGAAASHYAVGSAPSCAARACPALPRPHMALVGAGTCADFSGFLAVKLSTMVGYLPAR